MKRFLVCLMVSSVCLAENATVDFRQTKLSSVDVDMVGKEGVEIFVEGETEPDVLVEDGPLAHCLVTGLKSVARKTYRVEVAFDPMLDEGVNGCTILVGGPARVRRVNCNIYVTD
ncbi:MAG: hypothetical protein HYR96_11005 [Deltaproteobacteria bacterium]|nr:hypothetical protein [Deltaproteobacteria bacterium]MBI3293971.1 hypothetical protein [Deltaproteobacteria bacterium]